MDQCNAVKTGNKKGEKWENWKLSSSCLLHLTRCSNSWMGEKKRERKNIILSLFFQFIKINLLFLARNWKASGTSFFIMLRKNEMIKNFCVHFLFMFTPSSSHRATTAMHYFVSLFPFLCSSNEKWNHYCSSIIAKLLYFHISLSFLFAATSFIHTHSIDFSCVQSCDDKFI